MANAEGEYAEERSGAEVAEGFLFWVARPSEADPDVTLSPSVAGAATNYTHKGRPTTYTRGGGFQPPFAVGPVDSRAEPVENQCH